MFRSLHMKLTLILLLLITSLMAVVGTFLTTSVSSFYIDSFYQQMDSVFGAGSDFYPTLCAEAQEGGAQRLQELVEVRAGSLGVDYSTRNYYILNGSGSLLLGSDERSSLDATANLLAARPNKVYSRTDLMEQVWNYDYVGDDARTVDVTVRRLREKVEADPANPVHILTRRGAGYYFAK